jgi:hypothetical protein
MRRSGASPKTAPDRRSCVELCRTIESLTCSGDALRITNLRFSNSAVDVVLMRRWRWIQSTLGIGSLAALGVRLRRSLERCSHAPISAPLPGHLDRGSKPSQLRIQRLSDANAANVTHLAS